MEFQPAADQVYSVHDALEGGATFLDLLSQSIDHSLDAVAATDADVQRLYRNALELISASAARAIDEFAESKIEKRFARALVLSFVNRERLGLLVHPLIEDAESEAAAVRRSVLEARWFDEERAGRHKDGLIALLDDEMTSGRMSPDDWRGYRDLTSRYRVAPFGSSYRMTLQPRFPTIRIAERSVRPDLYFWIPSRPEINVIVECDGYGSHWTRTQFTRDRQRDRAFRQRGYDVLRFSGSEINSDTISCADWLADYLIDRVKAVAESPTY